MTSRQPSRAAGAAKDRGSLWPFALGAIVLVIGAGLRVSQIDQTLIADELWSFTGATRPSFGSMFDYVQSDEEITPPLFTILAWLAARISDSASVLRLPSVVPGILTIPLVFGIGWLALGRRVALTAAALVALSPFLIWQSVELRAYSLATMFVAASTLLLLVAIERRHWSLWAGFALMTCAAMYSHYTAVYALLAQFIWVMAFHPDARRQALLANAAAAVAFVPWIPSLIDDLQSPSQDIIEQLSPFGFHSAVDSTVRFAFGNPAVGLREFVGMGGEVLLMLGIAVALAGLVSRAVRGDVLDARRRNNIVLLALLGLAAPVGVAFVSLVGSDQFLPRNLSTSAPGALLLLAALLMAGTVITRLVSAALVIGVFAFGAARDTEPRFQRLDYVGAAAFIDATAGPDDVVLDVGFFTPGSPPASTLDINFDEPHDAIDAITPEEMQRALTQASGDRLYLVGIPPLVANIRSTLGLDDEEPVEDRTFDGVLPVTVQAFEIAGSGSNAANP